MPPDAGAANTANPLPFTLADVRAAASRIAPHVRRTPVLTSRSLNAVVSARLGFPVDLRFKCEVFQRGGAFKARGAVNAVLALLGGGGEQEEEDRAAAAAARAGTPGEGGPAGDGGAAAAPAAPSAATRKKDGVCTHSSGNHAAALALAASLVGVPAHIVMPRNAPRCKIAATEAYGGRIVFCSPTLKDREEMAAKVQRATGAVFVPPYDHALVAAGQGTLALEMLEDEPQPLDALIVPVSGGGMLSGCAVAAKGLLHGGNGDSDNNGICILAAEPRGINGVADAKLCLEKGELVSGLDKTITIADGLQARLGERVTWPVIERLVDGVLDCEERDLVEAMRLVAERMKIVVEPSGGCGLAALLAEGARKAVERAAARHAGLGRAVARAKAGGGGEGGDGAPVRIGIVLCGGNVDWTDWFDPERWRGRVVG